jgi:hypothetical protein
MHKSDDVFQLVSHPPVDIPCLQAHGDCDPVVPYRPVPFFSHNSFSRDRTFSWKFYKCEWGFFSSTADLLSVFKLFTGKYRSFER